VNDEVIEMRTRIILERPAPEKPFKNFEDGIYTRFYANISDILPIDLIIEFDLDEKQYQESIGCSTIDDFRKIKRACEQESTNAWRITETHLSVSGLETIQVITMVPRYGWGLRNE